MQLLGIDAGRYETPRTVEEIVLTPGNRADVLITAVEGTSVLRTLPFDRGTMGMMGTPAECDHRRRPADGLRGRRGIGRDLAAVPRQPAQRDLRGEALARQRTVTLAMAGGGGGGGMAFTIDGKQFDPERIDISVAHDSIEEWTAGEHEPDGPSVPPPRVADAAHRLGGAPVATIDWQDVVTVPAGGATIVRIAFEGITGRTAYHCHILDHEDNGMMGVIHAA